MAGLIGASYTGFKAAMEKDSAWETVQTAIRLAREMGTTVEYLFDPKTDWPPDEGLEKRGDVSRMAVEALERMGATDELARLAAGTPPKPDRARPKKPKAGSKKAKRKKS